MTTLYVLAPDALISARGGVLRVALPGAALPPLETDQPGLIGWITRFATPQDIDALAAELPPQSRALATRAAQYLREMGALRPAASVQSAPADAHVDHRDALSRMMVRLYSLACDVAGLGPEAQAGLLRRDGIGLDARLATLEQGLQALASDLGGLRRPYLQAQLAALGVDAQRRDLDLHIGCGPCVLPGWINIDIHPAPLATNVLWGLPFADGAARHVFLSHLLEHLFYPNDVHPFLQDIRRVLAPGGVVRIIVPDIAACIAAYRDNDAEFFAARRRHWGGDDTTTRLEDFLAYAGAGPDPAWMFQAHKFGYDYETLARALERAGFVDIRRCDYMQSPHAALRVDCHSEVADARHGERHYSLFVEARAPSHASGAATHAQ